MSVFDFLCRALYRKFTIAREGDLPYFIVYSSAIL